jgi:ubiquinone/menaquinone biosynthesis C-methylase UbiE
MTELIAFDRAAGYYDATRGFPPGEDINAAAFLAQVAGIQPTSRVLEIGVGTGRIAVPLRAHTGLFVGVDISVPMMDVLRDKQRQAAQQVQVVLGDVQRLPLPAASVDYVLAVHILHLVPDAEQTLREAARVLRPGGLMLDGKNDPELSGFTPIWDAWRSATKAGDPRDARWERSRTIFEALGWRQQGEPQRYSFIYQQSPAHFADRFRKRQISSTWAMDDATWQAGVDAVEQAIRDHFPDPDAVQAVGSSFTVRMFAPPA